MERLLRWGLGALFLWAGFAKLLDLESLVLSIKYYQMIDGWLILPVACILPWLEILCGACLIIGRRWRVGALCWTGGMLIVFSVILIITLLRGLDIDCGCFGEGLSMSVGYALLRNLVLLVAWTGALFLGRRLRAAEMQGRQRY